MSLFKEIVNESLLLNELRTNRDDDIKKAINNVLRVRISYDDKKKNSIHYNGRIIPPNKGKNERYILPVAYGLTKNGKRAIRAYQTAGSTKRGVPKWKLFLLDNIYSWANGKKSFKEYGDALIRLGLNTKGDKHMTTLFAVTPIGNENVPVANDSNPIGAKPISKPTVQPDTEIVQNPKIVTKTNDFVPSQTKRNTSIDNSQNKTYFDNKIEAPETEPITKSDIQQQDNVTTQGEQKPQITTEPVTKNDVNGGEDIKDNKLTNSFNDMMNRMDNLYNDEEDK